MDRSVLTRLEQASDYTGGDPDQVLRRVLHLGEFSLRSRYFNGADELLALLLDRLDLELCVRNPGLHYVERAMYVGYRREELPRRSVLARSQVFLSVLLSSRQNTLVVILPLKPDEYELAENMRDVSSIGHHGVGDIEVTLRSEGDIVHLFGAFGSWLSSPAGQGDTP